MKTRASIRAGWVATAFAVGTVAWMATRSPDVEPLPAGEGVAGAASVFPHGNAGAAGEFAQRANAKVRGTAEDAVPAVGATDAAPAADLDGLPPARPEELDSLVAAIQAATGPAEKGRLADRLASIGGQRAVEELFLLSLEEADPANAAAIREAFKGLTSEEDIRLLASALAVTTDFDVIESVVETVSRGATGATVEYLVQVTEDPLLEPVQRYAARWAIERIRSPEAARALEKLVGRGREGGPGEAAAIALAAMRAGGGDAASLETEN